MTMRVTSRWAAAGLLVGGLVLSGCSDTAEAESELPSPAKVEAIAGSQLSRLTLEARAIERVGIKTEPAKDSGAQGRKVVPYAAVIYDATGGTWVYTNPEPRVYLRQAIKVESIAAGQAVLSAGPAAGTAVVTVGAAELYGTELGVDH
jgi:hypothetical protein